MGPHSYAILKGLNFSTAGNNQVISNCAGVEKMYDGVDGASNPGVTQIYVRIPSPGIATACTFRIVRPDRKTGNTISLTMAAAPMQAPSISSLGGGCGCGCAWVLGNNFYNAQMEVHVRKANWDVIGLGSPVIVNSLTNLQFGMTTAMKNEFMSGGLRFTIFNPAIGQWVTSEPLTCQP